MSKALTHWQHPDEAGGGADSRPCICSARCTWHVLRRILSAWNWKRFHRQTRELNTKIIFFFAFIYRVNIHCRLLLTLCSLAQQLLQHSLYNIRLCFVPRRLFFFHSFLSFFIYAMTYSIPSFLHVTVPHYNVVRKLYIGYNQTSNWLLGS